MKTLLQTIASIVDDADKSTLSVTTVACDDALAKLWTSKTALTFVASAVALRAQAIESRIDGSPEQARYLERASAAKFDEARRHVAYIATTEAKPGKTRRRSGKVHGRKRA